MSSVVPTKVKLHKQNKQLELIFSSQPYILNAEFLRVLSPSAEVRGHGSGQAVLQYGKKQVGIERIAAAGNYALQIFFDDGHYSGIYTWDYLHELCLNEQALWHKYLTELHAAGKTREADAQVLSFK